MLFSGYAEKVAETTPGHHTVPGRQPARSPLHQRVPIRGKGTGCHSVFAFQIDRALVAFIFAFCTYLARIAILCLPAKEGLKLLSEAASLLYQ